MTTVAYLNTIQMNTFKGIPAQFTRLNLLVTECLYTARMLYARRVDAVHLFLWRTSALNVYYLQCLYSSMRFRNDSVFTEIFLNCIKLNRIVFARFGSVWTGPYFKSVILTGDI